jgi:hypothetical protein
MIKELIFISSFIDNASPKQERLPVQAIPIFRNAISYGELSKRGRLRAMQTQKRRKAL